MAFTLVCRSALRRGDDVGNATPYSHLHSADPKWSTVDANWNPISAFVKLRSGTIWAMSAGRTVRLSSLVLDGA